MSKKKVISNCNPDFLEPLKIVSFILLFIAVIAATAEGVGDAQSDYGSSREDCRTELSRIEYIFPFYRLGCWLGEAPEKKTCDN